MTEKPSVEQTIREFGELGRTTGMRMSWATIPADTMKSREVPIPPAVVYNPLQRIQGMQRFRRVPFMCPSCGGVINPYCNINPSQRLYTCPLCLTSQPVPAGLLNGYTQAMGGLTSNGTQQLPGIQDIWPELHPGNRTVEYVLREAKTPSPTFSTPVRLFFLIDTCMSVTELEILKQSILNSVASLPDHVEIGLAVFGNQVELIELGENRSFLFYGMANVPDKELEVSFGVHMSSRFLKPVSTHLIAFTEAVSQLRPDPWPVAHGHRPTRCFGSALTLAAKVMKSGHLLAFLAGPPTCGVGSITSTIAKETIRGWDDITNGTQSARFYSGAQDFYKSCIPTFLSLDGDASGASRDEFKTSVCPILFVGSPEQVGFLEMRPLVEATGGDIVFCETFSAPEFAESLRLFTECFVEKGSGIESGMAVGQRCLFQVHPSNGLRLGGLIGHGTPLKPKNPGAVGENRLGRGGTDRWILAGCDSNTSLAVILESQTAKGETIPQNSRRYVQLRFLYFDPSTSQIVMRVSTIHVNFVLGPMPHATALDQETAAVLICRICCVRADAGAISADVIRALDTALVDLCRKLGSYSPGNPGSFSLHPAAQLLPAFAFHMRRHPALALRGETPDQISMKRFRLMKRTVLDCLRLIQPPLFMYTALSPAPSAAPLDAVSMRPDCVLVLDTLDRVVVWYGSTVAKWRDDGWGEKEGYENVKRLIQQPQSDVQRIIISRFPAPHLTVCDEGGSQARFLLSRLNPSRSLTSTTGTEGPSILTDDISLVSFIDSLKRVVVFEAKQ